MEILLPVLILAGVFIAVFLQKRRKERLTTKRLFTLWDAMQMDAGAGLEAELLETPLYSHKIEEIDAKWLESSEELRRTRRRSLERRLESLFERVDAAPETTHLDDAPVWYQNLLDLSELYARIVHDEEAGLFFLETAERLRTPEARSLALSYFDDAHLFCPGCFSASIARRVFAFAEKLSDEHLEQMPYAIVSAIDSVELSVEDDSWSEARARLRERIGALLEQATDEDIREQLTEAYEELEDTENDAA